MTLNLATKLAEARTPKQSTLVQWIDTLDTEDQQALEAARTDEQISNAALIRILHDAGKPVSKDTLGKWRRGTGQ